MDIPGKPRSWYIAKPVYSSNLTECNVIVFGGSVHRKGDRGERDPVADLEVLSFGMVIMASIYCTL